MPPPINWDGTTWWDVHEESGIPHEAGYTWFWDPNFNWGKFSDDVLWFGLPPDVLAARMASGLSDVTDRVFDQVGDAAAVVAGRAADEGKRAASNTWSAVAPYLAAAAVVLLAVEARRAR